MSENTQLCLRLEQVGYWRAESTLLYDVCWQVNRGEHWAVLGPNGSGKTTLLLIATGYLSASTGSVYLLEGYLREIVLPVVRERVGLASPALYDVMLQYHPQTTGLDVVLSGRYASLGLYRPPAPDDVRQAHALLAEAGMPQLAGQPFASMSSGERQQCLVARTRLAACALVLLDEPCSGLDLGARERALQAIRRACQNQPDVPHVIVTHHAEEIIPEITHVLLLREGTVIAQGPRDAVLTAEALSATYGVSVRVEHEQGRVWVLPRVQR